MKRLAVLACLALTACEPPKCTDPAGHHSWGKWQDDPKVSEKGDFMRTFQRRFCEKCGVCQGEWH